MQSMIKREVSLSLTAHSEFIRQMILDGLEIARHRCQKYNNLGVDHMLSSNAIYYRNMRQNGHSTALRTVFSSPDFDDIGIISVFTDANQRTNFLQTATNGNNISDCLFTEHSLVSGIGRLRGQKIEVLVFNDYISIAQTGKAWQLLQKVLIELSHLRLVVFLG